MTIAYVLYTNTQVDWKIGNEAVEKFRAPHDSRDDGSWETHKRRA
jgi:hypothetical protein